MTREEKDRQIRKEARATLILFAICFFWHVGFGYLLSGSCSITVFGLPLWWVLSTPGVFVVAVVGVIYLLKKVFVNFSLEDDDSNAIGGSKIDVSNVGDSKVDAGKVDSSNGEEA